MRGRQSRVEGEIAMIRRRPRLMSTLQGICLSLTIWIGLSFYGIRGLVTGLDQQMGGWFWLSVVIWLSFPLIYLLDFARYAYVKWVALAVGLVTLGIEYSAHWHGLIFPGSENEVARYYAYFDKLYLFGPFEGRIAPDLYYVFLDFLLLALVWIAIKRVAFRAYH